MPEARPAPRGVLIGGSRFASRRRPGPFALSLARRPGGGGAAGGGAARGCGAARRGGASPGTPRTGSGVGGRAVDAREGSPRASRGEQIGLLQLLQMKGIRQEAVSGAGTLAGEAQSRALVNSLSS